jgi:hypothetical protein
VAGASRARRRASHRAIFRQHLGGRSRTRAPANHGVPRHYYPTRSGQPRRPSPIDHAHRPSPIDLQPRLEHLEERVQLFGEEIPHVADPDDLVFLFEEAGGELPAQRGEVADDGAR